MTWVLVAAPVAVVLAVGYWTIRRTDPPEPAPEVREWPATQMIGWPAWLIFWACAYHKSSFLSWNGAPKCAHCGKKPEHRRHVRWERLASDIKGV